MRRDGRTADAVRDALLRAVYAVGWRGAAKVPWPVVQPLLGAAASAGRRRGGRPVEILRHNLAALTGQPVPPDLVLAALASYLRNFYEVLALPGWSPAEIVRRVSTVNEQVLRDAYRTRGAVVALPHSGNWDLAGAWAGYTGMPVTTVAERLPDREFSAFVAFRARLGIQVLSHRDPAVVAQLTEAVRRGRLVCLLADRDLGGTGLPVRWRGMPLTMPGGPALVARRTGAALIPAVCRYTPRGMVIVFGAEVPARPGRAGLLAMTQDVADFFAATVAEQPADWHMFQPFFPGLERLP